MFRTLSGITIKFLGKVYSAQKKIKKWIFLKWIGTKFRRIGTNPHIDKPIDLRGGEFISIGDSFTCNPRLRLDALHYLQKKPEIIIGNNVNINYDCHIGCVNKIIIGDNVLIASKVYITDHSHGETDFNTMKIPPRERPIISRGPVIIEDNVWIGEGAVILPSITIGANSIIGANSVVTKSVPPFSVVAGSPAKIIKIHKINE